MVASGRIPIDPLRYIRQILNVRLVPFLLIFRPLAGRPPQPTSIAGRPFSHVVVPPSETPDSMLDDLRSGDMEHLAAISPIYSDREVDISAEELSDAISSWVLERSPLSCLTKNC